MLSNMPVLQKYGSACMLQEALLEWWHEHYTEALNHPKAPQCNDLQHG